MVSADELFEAVWHGRIVSLSTLTSRISAARAAIGDTGSDQRLIKTVARRGYRFIGEASPTTARRAPDRHAPHQEVQFCRAATASAWPMRGSAPARRSSRPATGSTISSTTGRARSGATCCTGWRAAAQLIRYDARGNGLSDWDVPEISFDAFVRDLEAVVDAAGLDRFALFGASQGCAFSIAYAVKYPDRVEQAGALRRLCPRPPAARLRRRQRAGRGDADADAHRLGPGQPGLPPGLHLAVRARRHARADGVVQRAAAQDHLGRRTPSGCASSPTTWTSSSCCRRCGRPTLVLHCRDDAVQPFEEGRFLAAGIPGARFVGLEGRTI